MQNKQNACVTLTHAFLLQQENKNGIAKAMPLFDAGGIR